MDLLVKRVEDFLHQRIPVSKAMNCQVLDCHSNSITIRSPKFTNTVEGDLLYSGSAVSLGMLAAWTLLQVGLRRLDYEPEIHMLKSDWRQSGQPQHDDNAFVAKCALPSDKEWQQFLRMLSRKAVAKISIATKINIDDTEIGILTCEYETHDLDQG